MFGRLNRRAGARAGLEIPTRMLIHTDAARIPQYACRAKTNLCEVSFTLDTLVLAPGMFLIDSCFPLYSLLLLSDH
jgi:hypothetical protein